LTSERAFPPDRVYLACTLIMAAFVIDLIGFAPGIRVPSADEVASPVWFTLAMIFVFGSLTAWLAVETLRGRNWARWAMLVFLLLGWILGVQEIADSFARSPASSLIDAGCTAMEVAACWLLFSGASARWFRRDRQK